MCGGRWVHRGGGARPAVFFDSQQRTSILHLNKRPEAAAVAPGGAPAGQRGRWRMVTDQHYNALAAMTVVAGVIGVDGVSKLTNDV